MNEFLTKYEKNVYTRRKESREENERKKRRQEYLERMKEKREEFLKKPRQFLYIYDPIELHSILFPDTLLIYSDLKGRFTIDNITKFKPKLYEETLSNLMHQPDGDKILLNLLKFYCSLVGNCFCRSELLPRKVESDCLILKFLIKKIKEILPIQSYDTNINEVTHLMVNDKINDENYTLDGFIKRDKVPSQMIESTTNPTIFKSRFIGDDGYGDDESEHEYENMRYDDDEEDDEDKYNKNKETEYKNTMELWKKSKGGKNTKRRKSKKRRRTRRRR